MDARTRATAASPAGPTADIKSASADGSAAAADRAAAAMASGGLRPAPACTSPPDERMLPDEAVVTEPRGRETAATAAAVRVGRGSASRRMTSPRLPHPPTKQRHGRPAFGTNGASLLHPPRPPPPLQLLDLPDDCLGLITHACFERAAYVPLFRACRRLRDVGYASVAAVTIESRPEASVFAHLGDRRLWRPPEAASPEAASPATPTPVASAAAAAASAAAASAAAACHTPVGARVEATLESVTRFLVAATGVRGVTLHHPYGDGVAPWPATVGVDAAFYERLAPTLRRLPLSSVSAAGVAIPALAPTAAGGSVSAAPLRRLALRCIEGGVWDAVIAGVLAAAAGSLVDLTLDGVFRVGEPPPAHPLAAWLTASGGMPRLASLCLGVDVDAAAAAAVARFCPALVSLDVDGDVGAGVGAALRLPALPRLTELAWSWVVPDDAAEAGVRLAAEVPPLLERRTWASLCLPDMHGERGRAYPFLVPALVGAAALPPSLDLVEVGTLDDAQVAALAAPAAATRRLSTLRLALAADASAVGLAALHRLPALRRLTLVLPAADPARLRLGAWPVGGLTRLALDVPVGVAWPGLPGEVLAGLAASPSRGTLVWLRLAGGALREASAAAPLTALTRLAFLDYHLRDGGGGSSPAPTRARQRRRRSRWPSGSPAARRTCGCGRGCAGGGARVGSRRDGGWGGGGGPPSWDCLGFFIFVWAWLAAGRRGQLWVFFGKGGGGGRGVVAAAALRLERRAVDARAGGHAPGSVRRRRRWVGVPRPHARGGGGVVVPPPAAADAAAVGPCRWRHPRPALDWPPAPAAVPPPSLRVPSRGRRRRGRRRRRRGR
ncbi:hypothetical protein BU14_1029s0003 [Porphyra umbilicalis]|uniref:Uncharacterized protein n=1 Tax=Porphyra umbilicalis TaxID=2786 RepID=A0A1X6NMT2_PORUM|nr:hypothetical protein BU14_1029s0003 [Porphyra umbilicalis]|eukprot:OSX69897.1 hypothetical protein BU14_1029s0003 [Porphyra umbilicalis]